MSANRRATVLLSVGLAVGAPVVLFTVMQGSLKEFLDVTRGAGAVTVLLISLFGVGFAFYKLFWPFITERVRRQEEFANTRMIAMDLIAKEAIGRSQDLLVKLHQEVGERQARRDEELTRVLESLTRRIEDKR